MTVTGRNVNKARETADDRHVARSQLTRVQGQGVGNPADISRQLNITN